MDEHELPVEQMCFDEVEADKRGVVLCSTPMAQHFLDPPKAISVEALALLFVDTHRNLTLLLKPSCARLSFRPRCTKDYTLIFGHIMQLGDSEVQRSFTGQGSAPEIITTQVLKIGRSLWLPPSEHWFNAWRHCNYAKVQIAALTVPSFILRLMNSWTMSSLRYGLLAS